MTQPEESKENNLEEADKEDNENEKSMLQKRISALMLILGGVTSAFITNLFINFSSPEGLLPVLPVGIIIILVLKFGFDEFSGKTALFVFLVTTVMWFISGTFILQLS
jgi:hypothetical protein